MYDILRVDKDNIHKLSLWWTENSTSLVLAEPTSAPSPSLSLSLYSCIGTALFFCGCWLQL